MPTSNAGAGGWSTQRFHDFSFIREDARWAECLGRLARRNSAVGQHIGPLTHAPMSMPLADYGPFREWIGQAFTDHWTPAQDYARLGETRAALE